MSKPTVETGVGSYTLKWDEGVRIDVSRVREHTSDGRVTGEVEVRFGKNGNANLLHRAQFNFSSTRTRSELAKELSGRAAKISWKDVLEQACYYIVDLVRQGEPVVELWGDEAAKPPRFLIDPLVIEGYPNIFFGDPGSFKSALATVSIAIVTLPWQMNPLGLTVQESPTISLYLDWETDRQTVNWTLSRLFRGHSIPAFPVNYRRCATPLAQDIDAIKGMVSDIGARLVVIDSLSMAAGGVDLNTSGPATSFYTALRQLDVTSLILAHNSKDREAKARSIIGHQTFTAQARNIWEVRKVQETGEDEIDLALFHRKAPPFSRMASPIGTHVTFTPETMFLKAQPATTVREFVADMGLKVQITDALTDGAMTTKELADALNANQGSVKTILNRLKSSNAVYHLPDNRWGLAQRE